MESQHSNPQTEEYARKRIEESPFHNLMRELSERLNSALPSNNDSSVDNANTQT